MNAIARQFGRGKKLRDKPLSTQPISSSSIDHVSSLFHNQENPTGLLKPIGRESRLTIGGAVYIGVSLFLAIGAINSQNNLLFWLFGVAIATLVVSGLFSGNALMRIRLSAQSIPDVHAGNTVKLHYTVQNQSKLFPLFAAVISEVPNNQHPNDVHPQGMLKPAAVLHIGTRQTIRVYGSITPSRRGRYSVRQIRLSSRFPFGLLHKTLIFECHRQMMVMPYQLTIKPGLVRIEQGIGEKVRKRTRSSGVSNEYWGMREYKPGDPMRLIAWKQSARHDSLVVIEHAVPISSKLWVWVPNFSAGDQADENDCFTERSIALSAAIIGLGSRQGVPVGLWIPALGIQIQPNNGRRHTGRCLRALSLIDTTRKHERDIPPPALMSDDVIKLSTTYSSDHSAHFRSLDIQNPSSWLIDPSTLPASLVTEHERGQE